MMRAAVGFGGETVHGLQFHDTMSERANDAPAAVPDAMVAAQIIFSHNGTANTGVFRKSSQGG